MIEVVGKTLLIISHHHDRHYDFQLQPIEEEKKGRRTFFFCYEREVST